MRARGKCETREGLSFYGDAGNGSPPEKVFAALARMQVLGESFRLKARRPAMRGRGESNGIRFIDTNTVLYMSKNLGVQD